jgi:DNA replication protein DnaC
VSDSSDLTPVTHLPVPDAAHPAWSESAYSIQARAEIAWAEIDLRPDCPLCQGSGRARLDTDGVITMGRCRCQKLPDRIQIFNRAGLPARFAEATFVSFAQEPDGSLKDLDPSGIMALGTCSQWVEGFQPEVENRGLVLHGPVGRGKTHLMIALLRDLIFRHGVEVRFIEFSRLLSMLKEGYSSGKSDAGVLGEIATVPVLAIDELGKGRLTEWELAVIDEVISRRYNAMGCTIATTNYGPGEPTGFESANLSTAKRPSQRLADRVGDRVYSRLCEVVDFIEVSGKDHRKLPQ